MELGENQEPLVLRVSNLHWLEGSNDSADLCAHGGIELKVGEEWLSLPASNDWCVSAATLYLLRTLTGQHISGNPPGTEPLIPHCGHSMFSIEGEDDVVIVGCSYGVDWDVRHRGEEVILSFENGATLVLPYSSWRDLICSFSDQVEAFYHRSAPKKPYDDVDAEGYAKFRDEWERRRREADQRYQTQRLVEQINQAYQDGPDEEEQELLKRMLPLYRKVIEEDEW